MINMFKCEGKIAFVTGALGIIGRAYTNSLLQNKIKGVALIDVQDADATYQRDIETKYGAGKYLYIKTNVTNKNELKNAFEKTIAHFGQLDIVINNAGIFNEDEYENCLNTNFMAVMHGTMMAIHDYLPKHKKATGVIVNTASIAGAVTFSFPVYCISKHAALSIGLCFARNKVCKENDIRVMTICPGATPSPMFDDILKAVPTPAENDDDEEGKRERLLINAKNADYLGDALIKIMRSGSNGSIWMCQDGKEPYNTDYEPFQEKVMKYYVEP